MRKSISWRLRQRDNRRAPRGRDVLAARAFTGETENAQPVGSRLTEGAHGVDAPAVTGGDVPATAPKRKRATSPRRTAAAKKPAGARRKKTR